MPKPKRGEVWRFRLSGSMGREMGAKQRHAGPVRLCVVISHDAFNTKYNRLTVVPITGGLGRKDITLEWCVSISRSDYPSWLDEDSYVDCSQPWTVYAIGSRLDDRDDIRSRCLGRLNQRDRERVEDDLLKMFTGRDLPYPRREEDDAPYPLGQVLKANFLNIVDGREYLRECLVVSDPLFEANRQKDLKLVTVVPLVSLQYLEVSDPDVTVPVEVVREGQAEPEILLAQCWEIYTIDWQNEDRDTAPCGRIRMSYMSDVHNKLYNYLHLPKEEEES